MDASIISQFGPVIIVSGTAAVILTTVFLQLVNHNTNIRTKSFDTILLWSRDPALRKVFSDVRNLKRDKVSFEYNPDELEVKDTLLELLNFYEAIAIGIKERALQESIIKYWWRTSFVHDFIMLKDFIEAYRSDIDAPLVWLEVELLAKNWMTQAEKKLLATQIKK